MSDIKIVTHKIVPLIKVRLMAFVPAYYTDMTKSWNFGAITDYVNQLTQLSWKLNMWHESCQSQSCSSR